MKKKIFYEGQHVGCLMFGQGMIVQMDPKVVSVSFNSGIEEFYHDGTYMQHLRPTLYPLSQYREIIANLPAPQPEAWKPKPGDWCWFYENPKYAIIDRFKEMNENLYRNISGYTYSNCAQFVGELPEHLKEVQP